MVHLKGGGELKGFCDLEQSPRWKRGGNQTFISLDTGMGE
jgi:hypothetical protein